MKVYDLVKLLLQEDEKCRNSDAYLQWQVWKRQGKVSEGIFEYLTYSSFASATAPESIRRCRQKIQEECPDLQATSEKVRKARQQKEEDKGTFIYREELWK